MANGRIFFTSSIGLKKHLHSKRIEPFVEMPHTMKKGYKVWGYTKTDKLDKIVTKYNEKRNKK